MVTSEGSVPARADLGITYFDTGSLYSGGNNERMVGRAQGQRNSITLSSKNPFRHAAGGPQRPGYQFEEWHRFTGYLVLHSKTNREEVSTTDRPLTRPLRRPGKILLWPGHTHAGSRAVLWLARPQYVDVHS